MSSTAGKTEISDISAQPPETETNDTQKGNHLKLLRQSLAESARKCRRDLAVSHLLKPQHQLELSALTQETGLNRKITHPYLQRLGLALTGYGDDFAAGSLLWLGSSEIRWLQEQPAETWEKGPELWARSGIAALVLPNQAEIPQPFLNRVQQAGLPILRTTLTITAFLDRVWPVLSEHLSPQICFHGNLLVISGLGVLILGKSGIGKSDDALDLIMHGHQLVADDVVHVHRNTMGKLIGSSDELTKQHMTIRGLGIVNIKELFGITAVLDSHPIDLILYLEPWEMAQQYALQQCEDMEILGVNRPMMRLPVAPGRNLENLITVAVKTHVLQTMGYNAERQLCEKLERRLENPITKPDSGADKTE